MAGGNYGGVDPTRGFDKVGDLSDFDLNKQVRKPKAQPADERIFDRVDPDSIADFVEASKAAKHAAKNPLSVGSLIRRLFRR